MNKEQQQEHFRITDEKLCEAEQLVMLFRDLLEGAIWYRDYMQGIVDYPKRWGYGCPGAEVPQCNFQRYLRHKEEDLRLFARIIRRWRNKYKWDRLRIPGRRRHWL